MADYIRRDIVLQIINTVHETGGFAGYADYCTLFDEIDTMPTADVQPVDRWISVNDRLPLIEHLYSSMTCICCTKKGSVLPLRYVCTLVRKKKVYRWELMNGSLWGDDVAYWQPLPEPPETTKG